MRRHFIALAPSDSVLDAMQVMRMARLRGLPVAEGDRLLGQLVQRELVRGLLGALATEPGEPALELLRSTRVQERTAASRGIAPEAPLAAAVALLCECEGGYLPVVETGPWGERLVGLLVESDLLRALYGAAGPSGLSSSGAASSS